MGASPGTFRLTPSPSPGRGRQHRRLDAITVAWAIRRRGRHHRSLGRRGRHHRRFGVNRARGPAGLGIDCSSRSCFLSRRRKGSGRSFFVETPRRASSHRQPPLRLTADAVLAAGRVPRAGAVLDCSTVLGIQEQAQCSRQAGFLEFLSRRRAASPASVAAHSVAGVAGVAGVFRSAASALGSDQKSAASGFERRERVPQTGLGSRERVPQTSAAHRFLDRFSPKN